MQQMAVIALNSYLLSVVTFLMVNNMLLSAYRLPLTHVSTTFFIFWMTYMPHKKQNRALENIAENIFR